MHLPDLTLIRDAFHDSFEIFLNADELSNEEKKYFQTNENWFIYNGLPKLNKKFIEKLCKLDNKGYYLVDDLILFRKKPNKAILKYIFRQYKNIKKLDLKKIEKITTLVAWEKFCIEELADVGEHGYSYIGLNGRHFSKTHLVRNGALVQGRPSIQFFCRSYTTNRHKLSKKSLRNRPRVWRHAWLAAFD